MSEIGNKEIFSKNLQYYMAINNKDRYDLVKDLKFPYSTVTDWINGNSYPNIGRIEILANYFNIEKSDLIEKRSLKKNRIPGYGKKGMGVLHPKKALYNKVYKKTTFSIFDIFK